MGFFTVSFRAADDDDDDDDDDDVDVYEIRTGPYAVRADI